MFILRNKIAGFLLLLAGLLSIGSQTAATSWVMLEPEEVVNRAEVVVQGTYDFTSEKVPIDHSVFTGINFTVKKEYKGEGIGSEIVAGLDGFDFGWVEEFQLEGGEFILFLEKRESSFLTPVGGPNGMVQMKNGSIIEHLQSSKLYYEEYLQKLEQEKSMIKDPATLSAATTPTPAPVDNKSASTSAKGTYLPILAIGIILILVLFLGRWMLKRK